MQSASAELSQLLDNLVVSEDGLNLSSLGITGDVTVSPEGEAEVNLRLLSPRRTHGGIEDTITNALRPRGIKNPKFTSELCIEGRDVAENDPVPEVKNIVLVMSGKGGVGKSTVCANTAMALSKLGAKVGLLDADIYGPSVPTLFGICEKPAGDGTHILPIERFGMKLMSIGFLLDDPKSAVIWRGPMLQSALMQFLGDVAWGPLDYLFLDLPPGTGDVALTLAQKLATTGALIVTTPEEMALQDVYKAVAMNQKVGITALGVVENQGYFVCPNCSTRHHLFGEGGGAKVAEQAGAPLLGQLPLDPMVQRCSDTGTPVVEKDPNSPAASAFFDLAERLARRVAEHNRSTGSTLIIDRSGGKNRHLPVTR